jgi:peptidoglycan/LPS O-acetylase OafA/YrhL
MLPGVPARSAQRPSTGSRLPGIEGLRALAAGSIVLYHCWRYSAPSGNGFHFGAVDRVFLHLPLGVTLFFTLSGFLLYRPFAAAVIRERRLPGIGAYLRNRALRILPASWFILLVVGLVLGAALVPGSGGELYTGSLAGHPGTFLSDALLVQGYSRGSILTGIGPAWSLAIEVIFYLALPVLGLIAYWLARRAGARRGRRLAALLPAGLLLLTGLFWKAVGTFIVTGYGPGSGWLANWHSVLERSFFLQADLFTFGMVVAVLRVEAEDGLLRLPAWWRKAGVVAIPAIGIPTAALTGVGHLNFYIYGTITALVLGLALALVVLPGSDGRPPRVLRVLESRPFVAVGLVSYSFFLWHEPLQRWLQLHGLTAGGTGGFFLNLLVIAVVAGILSVLTYRFIELPALRRKSRQPSAERRPVERELQAAQLEAAP